jgi:L-asparaginase
MQNKKVLLIYTGGTIGMITDQTSGSLRPFNFSQITHQVPELLKFKCAIDSIAFEKPIDSSNMNPEIWVSLVKMIEQNYDEYDGFVVLHGTDTMAYTASAVSFMIKNLSKPIVFTGSQLPIGIIRTDGKENLITAIEIASAYKNDVPLVPEVALYFEYKLFRANRTTKLSAHHFNAFESFNYPILAEAGIDIDYRFNVINPLPKGKKVEFQYQFETGISVLKLFPGISKETVTHHLAQPNIKAIILETYGSGNATTEKWFLEAIEKAIQHGVVIINITQCKSGKVDQTKYETGKGLHKLGVVGGSDLTIESAITKLMLILGNTSDKSKVIEQFERNWVGEKG